MTKVKWLAATHSLSLVRWAGEGKTLAEMASLFSNIGVTVGGHIVRRAMIKLGIPRAGHGARKVCSSPRSEGMLNFYQSGMTLQEIGDMEGITRERVRQIMNKHHGTTRADSPRREWARENKVRRAAIKIISREKKCREKNGCSLADLKFLRDIGRSFVGAGGSIYLTPIGAFTAQRSNAATRGIGFKLKLWEWWTIWTESGHWEERGRGTGYCMGREFDKGPYAVDNVSIISSAENTSVGNRDQNVGPMLPMGVGFKHKHKNFVANRMLAGKKTYLGTFPTPAAAHQAYINAGENT